MGKLVLIFGTMLFVSLVFFTFGLLSSDLEKNYIDTGISSALPDNSTWAEDFDITNNISSTMDSFIDDLEAPPDEENSWLESLFRGGMLVIGGLILVPGLAVAALDSSASLIVRGGHEILGIPNGMIRIALIGLSIWIAFRLIAFGRRYEA
mgnify:CR=1 FL=1